MKGAACTWPQQCSCTLRFPLHHGFYHLQLLKLGATLNECKQYLHDGYNSISSTRHSSIRHSASTQNFSQTFCMQEPKGNVERKCQRCTRLKAPKGFLKSVSKSKGIQLLSRRCKALSLCFVGFKTRILCQQTNLRYW